MVLSNKKYEFYSKPHLLAAIALGWGLTALFIGQRLFLSNLLYGENALSSLGVILVDCAVIAMATQWLARRNVGAGSLCVFCLACFLSLHYLHNSANDLYTNNLFTQIRYGEFIKGHWMHPFSYLGAQSHHPPLYFYLEALAIKAAIYLNIPEWTALRFLSWVCFLIFNMFGLATLHRAGLTQGPHLTTVALFLLWPASTHLASKINNEILLYAFYAASFYYLVLWYQEKKPHQLMKSLLIAAAGMTAKGSAIILLGLIALMMGISWYRKELAIRSLVSLKWLGVWCAVVVCIGISFAKVINDTMPLEKLDGWASGQPYSAMHFFDFSYNYFQSPFVTWSETSFGEYFLKTLVFEEYKWSWPSLAIYLNYLCLGVISCAVLLCFTIRRIDFKGMLPFVLGVAVPLLFLIFYVIRKNSITSQDARYVYPIIISFAALFDRAYTSVLLQKKRYLIYGSTAIVWSFVILSTIFFWNADHLR